MESRLSGQCYESTDEYDYGSSEMPPAPVYNIKFTSMIIPAIKGVKKWPSLK